MSSVVRSIHSDWIADVNSCLTKGTSLNSLRRDNETIRNAILSTLKYFGTDENIKAACVVTEFKTCFTKFQFVQSQIGFSERKKIGKN